MIGYLLLFIYAWTLISLFYGGAVVHGLRDRSRFSLYALRDQLREKAISGELDSSSFSFSHFESMLNAMIRMCERHNVSNLMYFLITTNVRQEVRHERQRFDAEAGPQLKALEADAMNIMLRVMLINSPLFVMFAIAVTCAHGAMRTTIEIWHRIAWHEDSGNLSYPRAVST